MASVTVFVDDAVRGHLPPLCVKTGAPADGTVAFVEPVNSPSAAWLLLVFLGPIAWIALIIMFAGRNEKLTVRLPMSTAAFGALRGLQRARNLAAVVAVAFAVLVVAHTIPRQWLAITFLAAVAAAAFHIAWQWRRVGVALDGSRRWVTLSGVDADFARAVQDWHHAAREPLPR